MANSRLLPGLKVSAMLCASGKTIGYINALPQRGERRSACVASLEKAMPRRAETP